MEWSASQILDILDKGCPEVTFPMLDNGYLYLAATRLSLFRGPADWAMVIEVFGFSPRAGNPDIHVHTFASKLHNRDKVEDYVTPEAHKNYLKNNPFNDSRFFEPIEEGDWIADEDSEFMVESGIAVLRGSEVALPTREEYAVHGIELQGKRPAVFEFCRYLAATHRDEVLATEPERRVSVLPEMTQLLQLEEWHHPDVVAEELPSEVESFQQLADVLVAADPSLYRPSKPPNTHWKNWPEGGTL